MLLYYIRNALEISQFILISSVNEIYELNISKLIKIISFVFSILMIVLYFIILGIVNYLIFSLYKLNEKSHNKLEEFFSCIQESKKARFYVTMLLLRRLIFVTLLLTLASVPSRQLIGVLIVIQFVYGAYIVCARPYKEAKTNFIEILNEIYFSLFLVTLGILNTEDEWNSLKTNIYVWILASNSMAVFIIIFGRIMINYYIVSFINNLVVKIKNKCQKTQIIQESTTKITPHNSFIPESDVHSHQPANCKIMNSQSIASTNQQNEESKYVVHEDLSKIQIVAKYN